MKTPIFGLMTTAGPSTTAANFAALSGGSTNTYGTTAVTRCSPFVRAGTIRRLTVFAQTALTQGSYVLTVQKATPSGQTALSFADTALTVTLDAAGQAQANSDTSNSFSVAAGDVLSLKLVPSGGTAPSNIGAFIFAVEFESTDADKGVILAGHRSGANAGFMAPGAYSASGGSQGDCSVPLPTAGVIDGIYVEVATAPGGSESRTVTVLKNGVATALTATVSGANLRASLTGQGVAFAAGDVLTLQETISAGALTGSNVSVGLDWDPTIDDEALAFATGTGSPSATVDNFLAGGGTGVSAVEANQLAVCPSASLTAKKLRVLLTTAPGAGNSRAFTFRKDGASQSLTTTISDANTTNNDATSEPTASAGEHLGFITLPTSNPDNAGNVSLGWVAVVGAGGGPVVRHSGLLLMGCG